MESAGYHKSKMPLGKPCPHWPRCRCIVQGYVNQREPNDCGKPPAPTAGQ